MRKITALLLIIVLLAACGGEQLAVAELSTPPAPQPTTFEQAEELFTLWWSKWGHEIRYMGEETVTNIGEWRGGLQPYYEYSDLPVPITLFVFETGDIRAAVSKDCGTIYRSSGHANIDSWTKGGTIAVRDETIEIPELFITDVTPSGLSYILVNQTDKEFMYGEDFRLSVKSGNGWKPFSNEEMAFVSIGYPIMPLSMTLAKEINWEWSFGELPAGEYKLHKGIHFGTVPDGNFEQYTLEQIFTIPRIN